MTLGMLIRGDVIREIKQFAWRQNYPITVDEDKGIFESTYRVSIDVPKEFDTMIRKSLRKFLESIE
jgi:hypothetical protein